jgi:hypothetical protein
MFTKQLDDDQKNFQSRYTSFIVKLIAQIALFFKIDFYLIFSYFEK